MYNGPMQTKRKIVKVYLDPDVVAAMRKYGAEQAGDDGPPWSPGRVAADLVTQRFANRPWQDRRDRQLAPPA